MTKKYKAAVIGGGVIGALMDKPNDHPPKTHAGAYRQHSQFELIGICETQPYEALQGWDVPVYRDLEALFDGENPDVVSVAVPETSQYEILKALLKTPVKAVVAEKPLAADIESAQKIAAAYESANIPLLVNYSRRFSLMYAEMGKRFQNGEERVITASARYAKGLLHNGSHAIDLALMLFGDVAKATALSEKVDFYEADPTITACLQMTCCRDFLLQGLDERCFTLFEVDIFTDQGRYVINEDHRVLTRYNVASGLGMPPGKRLVVAEKTETDYDFCLLRLLDNLLDVVENGAAPLCDGDMALRSMEIAHDLAQQLP